jgi:phosphate transport system permease protein
MAEAALVETAVGSGEYVQGERGRKLQDKIATALLWASAIGVVALLGFFIIYIFWNGISVMTWDFLTSPPKDSEAGGGIGPNLFNSFYILLLTLVMTIPIAVSAGIYLQEYATEGWFTQIVQFSAESLASIPSIVAGLFGLIVFVQLTGWKFTALGGALTLTMLNMPALMRVTQEALSTVPSAIREGSMGLGATKWQTITKVIVPSAMGALTTGIVLIAGRIFGETAALIYTSGVTPGHAWDFNPFTSKGTLAVQLWYTRSESLIPDVQRVGNGSALVLLAAVLIFNVLARILGRQLTKYFTGK